MLVCNIGQLLSSLKVGNLLGQRFRARIVQLVSDFLIYFNVSLFHDNLCVYMCIHNYACIIILAKIC